MPPPPGQSEQRSETRPRLRLSAHKYRLSRSVSSHFAWDSNCSEATVDIILFFFRTLWWIFEKSLALTFLWLTRKIMTLEEVHGQETVVESADRMQTAGKALHELLVSAQREECLTVGVYESAKVMNVDPDSVTFCILAADEYDEGDIALQIHFTLIQAFCCENDINIVRLNDTEKVAQILGLTDESAEPKDLHCILITVSVMFLLIGNVLALCPWL
ncbi:hypothetical protein XENTR_v10001859 [Xenopus tropicalis]|nr:hypothetical protein XENTR_v10001859 [Xenopus tropicalis]